jgi:hypothetical protein
MKFEAYRIGETDFECWDKLWKASPERSRHRFRRVGNIFGVHSGILW